MTGLEMKYFVLKPHGNSPYAKASRLAMLAYSEAIEDENYQLAIDLESWVNSETIAAADGR